MARHKQTAQAFNWDRRMGAELTTLALGVIQIIWIDVLLSGDNAIVIALACRGLPESQRRLGIWLGVGAAVLLRVGFALIIAQLLALPYLKLGGGLLLIWIGIKLVTDEEEHDIAAHSTLSQAVTTIAVADAVMSLDNVLAIVAAARGSTELVIFGLLISIPLVIAGSSLILKMIDRFPALIWLGAALIGYVAGEILITDAFMHHYNDAATFLMILLILAIPAIVNFHKVMRWILRFPTLLWLFGAFCGWAVTSVADHPNVLEVLNSLPTGSFDHYLPAFCALYVVGLAWLIERSRRDAHEASKGV